MLLFQKYFAYMDILPECMSGASLVPNEAIRDVRSLGSGDIHDCLLPFLFLLLFLLFQSSGWNPRPRLLSTHSATGLHIHVLDFVFFLFLLLLLESLTSHVAQAGSELTM